MRLRHRLAQELITRLTTYLPLPAGAVWDTSSAVCVLEQLVVTDAAGIQRTWQQTAEYQGRLRAELRADGVHALATEDLVASLLSTPLQLTPDDSAPVDALSESARAVLVEVRETLDPVQNLSVPSLLFRVTGSLVRKLAAPLAIHEVYLGQAPDIGQAHVADYQLIAPGGGAP